jgi:hypothetical protein
MTGRVAGQVEAGRKHYGSNLKHLTPDLRIKMSQLFGIGGENGKDVEGEGELVLKTIPGSALGCLRTNAAVNELIGMVLLE